MFRQFSELLQKPIMVILTGNALLETGHCSNLAIVTRLSIIKKVFFFTGNITPQFCVFSVQCQTHSWPTAKRLNVLCIQATYRNSVGGQDEIRLLTGHHGIDWTSRMASCIGVIICSATSPGLDSAYHGIEPEGHDAQNLTCFSKLKTRFWKWSLGC